MDYIAIPLGSHQRILQLTPYPLHFCPLSISLTASALMLPLIITILPVAVMLDPLLDNLIVEVCQARTFHLLYLFELLSNHLKL